MELYLIYPLWRHTAQKFGKEVLNEGVGATERENLHRDPFEQIRVW